MDDSTTNFGRPRRIREELRQRWADKLPSGPADEGLTLGRSSDVPFMVDEPDPEAITELSPSTPPLVNQLSTGTAESDFSDRTIQFAEDPAMPESGAADPGGPEADTIPVPHGRAGRAGAPPPDTRPFPRRGADGGGDQVTMVFGPAAGEAEPSRMTVPPSRRPMDSPPILPPQAVSGRWGDGHSRIGAPPPANSVVCGPALLRAGTVTYSGAPSSVVLGDRADNEWQRLADRLGAGNSMTLRWGDFEIERLIGLGGMGAVYLARQSSLDRTVAVKMIRGDRHLQADARRKFASEALVTGALDHPNVVPIYELGQAQDGGFYYAMKEVRGQPWSRVLKDRTEDDNLDTLLAVCDAVAFAHSKGFLHRDLKPDNVMLGDYGEILLMDWGLAVSIDPANDKAEPLSAANAFVGSPAYFAPEMARGDHDAIGTASDIYLLGAVLYEILTGKRPHSGGNGGIVACILAAAENEIVPSDRDDELIGVARRALSTDPADRPPTVKAFQQAIRECLAHGESLRLARLAGHDLAEARATGKYSVYNQAQYGFVSALKLWGGNHEARDGLRATRLDYARAAETNGDLDLALSLLESFGPGDAEAEALRAELTAKRLDRDTHARRLRRLRRAALALAGITLVVTLGALAAVTAAREREGLAHAESLAASESARQQSLRARDAAEAALRAKEAELAAKEAALKATEEKDRVVAELTEKGMLEDNSWWAFDAETAGKKQADAARALGVPPAWDVELAPGFPARFMVIPPGDFVMGSHPKDEFGRDSNEYLHRARLTRPFALMDRELTRGQWRAAVGIEPAADLWRDSLFKNPTNDRERAEAELEHLSWEWRTRELSPEEAGLPAVGISPVDVERVLLPKVGARAPAGWRFALPTEAQWEYAARAGRSDPYGFDGGEEALPRHAWFRDNAERAVHPGGAWPPNPWGLYDLHGNVAEIVRDYFDHLFYLTGNPADPVNAEADPPLRVIRGGSFRLGGKELRNAARSTNHDLNRYDSVGVRLALEPLEGR